MRAVKQFAPALRNGFNASTAMGTEHPRLPSTKRQSGSPRRPRLSSLLRQNLQEEVAALEKLGTHATRLAEQGAKEPAVRY